MPYVVCERPEVQLDIMVLRRYWAYIVSIVERTGCTYYKDKQIDLKNGNEYVVLRDVRADKGNKLGELIGLLYGLERDSIVNEMSENIPQRFYILLRPKKRGKKYVQKNWKETGSGSQGGNSGKSGDIRSGEGSGSGRSDNHTGNLYAVNNRQRRICSYIPDAQTTEHSDQ